MYQIYLFEEDLRIVSPQSPLCPLILLLPYLYNRLTFFNLIELETFPDARCGSVTLTYISVPLCRKADLVCPLKLIEAVELKESRKNCQFDENSGHP